MSENKQKLSKIFPRNLTARAVHQVVGNLVSTRLDSGAGNCFPGLEIDVRNLDRRFFPGLIFTFIDVQDYPPPYNDIQLQGAKLIYVDTTDRDLHWDREESAKLHKKLTGVKGTALKSGTWFLKSIEQQGKEISMYEYSEDGSKKPLSGLVVWRLIRCLKPGTLKIKLVSRNVDPKQLHTESEIELQGWRRLYIDHQTGVVSEVYLVGELGQSLCAPWTHDFRDCSCQYWASNHPDIVYGSIAPGEETLPDGKSADPVKAHVLLDWLREDRSPAGAAAAQNTIPKNRPFQFDHYQINQRWEELNIVLQNHEIEEVYTPMGADFAPPFLSSAEMVSHLRDYLAPLELALALEYLYAYYSICDPNEVPTDRWPRMKQDVTSIRHSLMLQAASEMTHLRWANQLLWELYHAGFTEGFPPEGYQPILEPATRIPAGEGKWRVRSLRPLTAEVLDDFIAVEKSSGFIDGAYARVVATLRQPKYPHRLYELAVRIVSDGVEHYSHFCNIKTTLEVYRNAQPEYPYLRLVTVGTPDRTQEALEQYDKIRGNLRLSYMEDFQLKLEVGSQWTHAARVAMRELNQIADRLADQGIGIPFWPDNSDSI